MNTSYQNWSIWRGKKYLICWSPTQVCFHLNHFAYWFQPRPRSESDSECQSSSQRETGWAKESQWVKYYPDDGSKLFSVFQKNKNDTSALILSYLSILIEDDWQQNPSAILCRRTDGSNAAVMTAAKPASLPPSFRGQWRRVWHWLYGAQRLITAPA